MLYNHLPLTQGFSSIDLHMLSNYLLQKLRHKEKLFAQCHLPRLGQTLVLSLALPSCNILSATTHTSITQCVGLKYCGQGHTSFLLTGFMNLNLLLMCMVKLHINFQNFHLQTEEQAFNSEGTHTHTHTYQRKSSSCYTPDGFKQLAVFFSISGVQEEALKPVPLRTQTVIKPKPLPSIAKSASFQGSQPGPALVPHRPPPKVPTAKKPVSLQRTGVKSENVRQLQQSSSRFLLCTGEGGCLTVCMKSCHLSSN